MSPSKQVPSAAIPTEAELLERARALVPLLRERADAIEKNRRVDDAIVQAFHDAGFFRILQARDWGGYGLDPSVFMHVLWEIGRGCCSSGWVLMILGVHQWDLALMPHKACAELWAEDRSILVGSSYAPFGSARKVDGGWILNGKWGTSSGTDHAPGGALLGARIFDEKNRITDHRTFLVRRSDYQQVDDWFTMGLCGTGSKSVQLNPDVFVPEYRSHSFIDYQPDPKRAPEYNYPMTQVFNAVVSSVVIGFAQGMIEHFTEQTIQRQGIFGIGAVALSPYVRDRLGNANALVRGSKARIDQIMRETRPYAERGEPVPSALRMQHALELARVGRDCEQAVLLLHKANSARGIYNSNPMQRILRDVLVAANHITQNADDSAGFLGGFMLGQGMMPPALFELPTYPD